VIDDVADRIEREPQRPAWRLPWRSPMNANYKLIAAAAAVLAVAVAGYNLLPRQPSVGGISTPSPTASPTASPTSTAVPLPEGTLTGGRYRLKPLPDLPSMSLEADVPAGWSGARSENLISPGSDSNTGILIGFMAVDGLFSDACHWDVDGTQSAQHGDVVVGPMVADLVTAMKANTSYTSSAATPVTIGGFDGQMIELQLPGNDVIPTCDRRPGETTGDYFVFPNGYYAQGPNSRWDLYILDVGGTRLITMVSIAEGTPEADIAAAQAIVESFTFSR